jgi:hypothetical protein
MRWGLSKGIEKDVLTPLSEKIPIVHIRILFDPFWAGGLRYQTRLKLT